MVFCETFSINKWSGSYPERCRVTQHTSSRCLQTASHFPHVSAAHPHLQPRLLGHLICKSFTLGAMHYTRSQGHKHRRKGVHSLARGQRSKRTVIAYGAKSNKEVCESAQRQKEEKGGEGKVSAKVSGSLCTNTKCWNDELIPCSAWTREGGEEDRVSETTRAGSAQSPRHLSGNGQFHEAAGCTWRTRGDGAGRPCTVKAFTPW